jgi:hypothetical protein
LSGGEAVVHIQRSGYGLPVNDRSGGASKDCFDAKPILQDPTNEALELT